MSGYKFARADSNQAQIIRELRQIGYQVDDVHSVRGLGYDIVVTGKVFGADSVATVRVEIKTATGKLTDVEAKKHDGDLYPQTLIIARSSEDVLDWFGRV